MTLARYFPPTRAVEKKPITAVLLGPLEEFRFHRREKRDGGSFPCLGKDCEYARSCSCTKDGFFRWHGCAMGLNRVQRKMTAQEEAAWLAKFSAGHRYEPPSFGIFLEPDRLMVSELYDSEIAELEEALKEPRGVVLRWSYPPRTIKALERYPDQRTLPEAFDLRAALERLYGMPMTIQEHSVEEEKQILKFRRKLA